MRNSSHGPPHSRGPEPREKSAGRQALLRPTGLAAVQRRLLFRTSHVPKCPTQQTASAPTTTRKRARAPGEVGRAAACQLLRVSRRAPEMVGMHLLVDVDEGKRQGCVGGSGLAGATCEGSGCEDVTSDRRREARPLECRSHRRCGSPQRTSRQCREGRHAQRPRASPTPTSPMHTCRVRRQRPHARDFRNHEPAGLPRGPSRAPNAAASRANQPSRRALTSRPAWPLADRTGHAGAAMPGASSCGRNHPPIAASRAGTAACKNAVLPTQNRFGRSTAKAPLARSEDSRLAIGMSPTRWPESRGVENGCDRPEPRRRTFEIGRRQSHARWRRVDKRDRPDRGSRHAGEIGGPISARAAVNTARRNAASRGVDPVRFACGP